MSSDAGERIPKRAPPDLSMPKVVDIKIRATTFTPPKHRHFESALAGGADAVEFIVQTASPIPIRALGPALYVGDTPVTEVTEIGPNSYRFVAPTRKGLAQNAAVHLTWTGQPPGARAVSSFRYRL